jgi:hypothetical protein
MSAVGVSGGFPAVFPGKGGFSRNSAGVCRNPPRWVSFDALPVAIPKLAVDPEFGSEFGVNRVGNRVGSANRVGLGGSAPRAKEKAPGRLGRTWGALVWMGRRIVRSASGREV